MSAHELSVGQSDEWYTPPYVFDAMGAVFDLDVAHPGGRSAAWVPAAEVLSERSLERPWCGFVWMNPPFGKRMALVPWLRKFFDHGDGVALTPDRTSAPWWQEFAPQADAVLFVREKIKFIRPDGSTGKQPGTGTTLLAKGARGVAALELAAAQGLGIVFRSSADTSEPFNRSGRTTN
jgi:hypothetical protein